MILASGFYSLYSIDVIGQSHTDNFNKFFFHKFTCTYIFHDKLPRLIPIYTSYPSGRWMYVRICLCMYVNTDSHHFQFESSWTYERAHRTNKVKTSGNSSCSQRS